MDKFKDNLRLLKSHYNVFSNKELSEKLDITESAIDGWNRRKSIPKKYLDLIQEHNNTEKSVQNEIINMIPKLNKQQLEYFYHLIKAEILKEQL